MKKLIAYGFVLLGIASMIVTSIIWLIDLIN